MLSAHRLPTNAQDEYAGSTAFYVLMKKVKLCGRYVYHKNSPVLN